MSWSSTWTRPPSRISPATACPRVARSAVATGTDRERSSSTWRWRGVPWINESCRRAGTVHVAGTFEEIAIAERATNRGEMPERPFLLVGQQYLADPSRSVDDLHPVWVYAHVPRLHR